MKKQPSKSTMGGVVELQKAANELRSLTVKVDAGHGKLTLETDPQKIEEQNRACSEICTQCAKILTDVISEKNSTLYKTNKDHEEKINTIEKDALKALHLVGTRAEQLNKQLGVSPSTAWLSEGTPLNIPNKDSGWTPQMATNLSEKFTSYATFKKNVTAKIEEVTEEIKPSTNTEAPLSETKQNLQKRLSQFANPLDNDYKQAEKNLAQFRPKSKSLTITSLKEALQTDPTLTDEQLEPIAERISPVYLQLQAKVLGQLPSIKKFIKEDSDLKQLDTLKNDCEKGVPSLSELQEAIAMLENIQAQLDLQKNANPNEPEETVKMKEEPKNETPEINTPTPKPQVTQPVTVNQELKGRVLANITKYEQHLKDNPGDASRMKDMIKSDVTPNQPIMTNLKDYSIESITKDQVSPEQLAIIDQGFKNAIVAIPEYTTLKAQVQTQLTDFATAAGPFKIPEKQLQAFSDIKNAVDKGWVPLDTLKTLNIQFTSLVTTIKGPSLTLEEMTPATTNPEEAQKKQAAEVKKQQDELVRQLDAAALSIPTFIPPKEEIQLHVEKPAAEATVNISNRKDTEMGIEKKGVPEDKKQESSGRDHWSGDISGVVQGCVDRAKTLKPGEKIRMTTTPRRHSFFPDIFRDLATKEALNEFLFAIKRKVVEVRNVDLVTLNGPIDKETIAKLWALQNGKSTHPVPPNPLVIQILEKDKQPSYLTLGQDKKGNLKQTQVTLPDNHGVIFPAVSDKETPTITTLDGDAVPNALKNAMIRTSANYVSDLPLEKLGDIEVDGKPLDQHLEIRNYLKLGSLNITITPKADPLTKPLEQQPAPQLAWARGVLGIINKNPSEKDIEDAVTRKLIVLARGPNFTITAVDIQKAEGKKTVDAIRAVIPQKNDAPPPSPLSATEQAAFDNILKAKEVAIADVKKRSELAQPGQQQLGVK